jgi:hypothetical protein
MACHGGTYAASTQGTPTVQRGNFLPFDTGSFLYSSTNLQLSEVAQREAFRKLNNFVKSTAPPSTQVADLIDGWYQWCGGANQIGCYIDEVNFPYIPGTWSTGGPATPDPGFDTRAFYTQVVAKKCRNCHIALTDRFDVQQDFASKAGNVRGALFYDAPNPLSKSRHAMPFGEVAYLDFWQGTSGLNGDSAAHAMRTFTAQCPQFPTPVTGDGTDLVTLQSLPNGRLEGRTQLALQVGPITSHMDRWWKAITLIDPSATYDQTLGETWTQDAVTRNSITLAAAPPTAHLLLKKAKTFGAHWTVQDLTGSSSGVGPDSGDCVVSATWLKDK